MSFATATARFAAQSARSLRALGETEIQPYTAADLARKDGQPLRAFLGPVRAERTLADTGFVVEHLVELRVLKACRWQPVPGLEFVDTGTALRYRVRTAAGAEFAAAAEIVAQCVRINVPA